MSHVEEKVGLSVRFINQLDLVFDGLVYDAELFS